MELSSECFWWIFHVSTCIYSFSHHFSAALNEEGGGSIPCCSLVDPLSSITCCINLQSRWIFGVKNRLLRRHKINALAKTLNLPHLTAGGASRPLTELGSWFLVNWEQELGVFLLRCGIWALQLHKHSSSFLLRSAHIARKILKEKKKKINSTTFFSFFLLLWQIKRELEWPIITTPASLYTHQKCCVTLLKYCLLCIARGITHKIRRYSAVVKMGTR